VKKQKVVAKKRTGADTKKRALCSCRLMVAFLRTLRGGGTCLFIKNGSLTGLSPHFASPFIQTDDLHTMVEINEVKNKLKRDELYQKQKTTKAKQKRERRSALKKEEESNPEKKEVCYSDFQTPATFFFPLLLLTMVTHL
jgi:hypothetical protein